MITSVKVSKAIIRSIIIPFPSIPQPRPRKTNRGTYYPRAYTIAKNQFESFLRARVEPLDGDDYPLEVEAIIYTAKAKNMGSDVDNHLKFICDRLTDSGVIRNDNLNSIRKMSIEFDISKKIFCEQTVINLYSYPVK